MNPMVSIDIPPLHFEPIILTYDAVVDAKLLDEAIAAFESIESLGKFVKLEKKRLDKNECLGALMTGDIPYLSVTNYSHISALLNEECLLP